MYTVYILRCKDNSLYVGITTDIDKRYKQHIQKTGAKYTKSHPVSHIEALWECENRSFASILEYRLKKLTKSKKEMLIKNNQHFYNYTKLEEKHYKKIK